MSSTYTGNAGNVTPANAVDITEPSDGDALNAASVNGALSELADYTAFMKRAAYDGTYTVKKLHINGTGNTASATDLGTLVAETSVSGATAVRGLGNGTGSGVAGLGGATGSGVYGLGGSTSGAGGDFAAQAGNSDGVRGTHSGSGVGVRAVTGGIKSDGAYDITSAQDVIATRALEAQTARASATAGSGQSVSAGRIWKEGAPLGLALIAKNGGGLVYGYNIASVAYPAKGRITVNLNTAAANYLLPVACVIDDADGYAGIKSTGIGTSSFEIRTYDNTGTLEYFDVIVHVFGV